MKRHQRENYYVVGEGILTTDGKNAVCERPSTEAALRKFRFSRIGPQGEPLDPGLLEKVATAMTAAPTGTPPVQPVADPPVPAAFTYLGQFVDHDLTLDNTAAALGDHVTVTELLQGRSPALDLDSLYGRGPDDRDDDRFYAPDKVKLRVGQTAAIPIDPATNVNLNGFDLPRVTQGSTKAERQRALVPDARNDENLIVAQTHLAFIRFHNAVADRLADQGVPSRLLFRRAKELVVRHYQWLLKTDFLPRVVDPAIVEDVFTNGRTFFETPATGPNGGPVHRIKAGDRPTMPIEFSVAAYRLGHSMVRAGYDWNKLFARGAGTLPLLFTFSGTSGNFNPAAPDPSDPETGLFERLPTNWAVDWRRMADFGEAGRTDLAGPNGVNNAQRIDTLLVNPLSLLPKGTFGGVGTTPPDIQRNLAFRNLTRAGMVNLASGQQMADFMGLAPLTRDQILTGNGGAALDPLTDEEKDTFAARTPLWFYILREAELNGGRLTGVGGRIVAEVFHRAMEGSRISIVADPAWRPTLGPDDHTFRLVDLLLLAFDGRKELLAPLGD
ncbi:heme peroxidase family protein [Actinoplanes sp. N902-109]|uniref:peroxidase family protein n=1 Tax=Actinoplanes sp. (strain N902-109) TaxID=649831 RepID=UPI0003294EA7|nr:heme peroxidase family protein [Actinoplanes sp. N902-109]AGL20066.1 heme peroxidase [Actinoplanes sp. N902-109]